MQRSLLTKIIYGLVAAFLIFYVVYQAVRSSTGSPVVTQSAVMYTMYDTAEARAFIVRDEAYIKSGFAGVMLGTVKDGERVAKGSNVALAFASAQDAENYKNLLRLNDEIAYYTDLNGRQSDPGASPQGLDRQIADTYGNMLGIIDSGRMELLPPVRDELRDLMNRRRILTGEKLDLTDKINSLKAEREPIKNAGAGAQPVQADSPGYFIQNTDGFEQTINYDKISELTARDVNDALAAQPGEVPSGTVGKLVDGFDWYAVCAVDSGRFADVKAGDTYAVEFPFSAVGEIEMTVAYINRDTGGAAALVLKSDLMNSGIAALRSERVDIKLKKYSGIRIPAGAVRVDGGRKGVYIRFGSEVQFRQIDVLFTGPDFVIVSGASGPGYVALYDEVIVKGKDLYDKKILR